MDGQQLREYIIRPILKRMKVWSQSAENLLLGTAAVESSCGYYIKQKDGPALGIYQMEPETHEDIIKHKSNLAFYVEPPYDYKKLLFDIDYSTRLCRLHYLRINEQLPDPEDIKGLGDYWKRYYNTSLGKGTVPKFVNCYKKYILRHAR